MMCHSRLPLLNMLDALGGSPMGSMSGWLRRDQLPLDSQNDSSSRTTTFS